MSFGEVEEPHTEHSEQILKGAWPSQSVMEWAGFTEELQQRKRSLQPLWLTQVDITEKLAPMTGAVIDTAKRLARNCESTLKNAGDALDTAHKQARMVANEIQETKTELVHIVERAEDAIKAAREKAEHDKTAARAAAGGNEALARPAIQTIEATLKTTVEGLVNGAHILALGRAAQGAATVDGYLALVTGWSAPNTLEQGADAPGGVPAPNAPTIPSAPAMPNPSSGGGGVHAENVDKYNVFNDPKEEQNQRLPEAKQAANSTVTKDGQDGTRFPNPTKTGDTPATTAPSSPLSSSGGSGPGSVIGQMMKPISSGGVGGGSPASMGSMMSPGSAGAGNGMGNPGGMNPAGAQAGQFPNATGAGTGVGTGAGAGAGAGAGRGPGLAGLGSGIAETSARMATGAVSGVANGLGAAANVGHQVAQNVAAAAVPAATTVGSSGVTTPAAAAPGVGGAPMAMMPPAAAAGATPVTPVSSTGPSGPAAPAQPVSGGGAPPPPPSSAPPGAQVAPLAMPQHHPGIRAIGADGATGEVLFEQAMDAGRDVIAALIAQTRALGYIAINFAVSLIYERTGGVTAWLATSEGPSSIPLGVGVPQDVRLAVTDPVVGRELWEETAAAGVAKPLEVVVRHAQAREMAAPGTRVLAIASSLKYEQMLDYTREVNARAVEVSAEAIPAATDLDGHLVHRCELAMPWEWRQAHAFDEQRRLQMAARHMYMAANAGHLHGAACEKVMRLFEERKPIDEALWAQVRQERFLALVDYETAVRNLGHGGAEPPARALATVRAAEVIESLRHYDTAEGFADLLYATRLAGAPLSPGAAAA